MRAMRRTMEWAAAAAEAGAAARAVDKNSSARRQCVEPSTPPCWGNTGLVVYWHNKRVVGRAASGDGLPGNRTRGRAAKFAQRLVYPGV